MTNKRGNPNGKRKGSVSLTAALARSLTKRDADAISRKLILLCKQGDVPALKLLFERLDDLQIDKRLCALEQENQNRNQ